MKKWVLGVVCTALVVSMISARVISAPAVVKPDPASEAQMQQVFYVGFLQGFFKSAIITLKEKGISDEKVKEYVGALANRVNDKELASMTWPCLIQKGLLSAPKEFNPQFKGEDAKVCFTPWIEKFQKDNKDLATIITGKAAK